MHRRLLGLWILFVLAVASVPHAQTPVAVRFAVQGETNLTTYFVDAFKREATEAGLSVQLSERSAADYNIVVAQESTLGSAAAAVIALDKDATLVASVVRSGRLSGKGSINACAKELAKRIAILKK